MSFIAAAVIGAGGAIAGGLISGNAASRAAAEQSTSAQYAADLQKQMFEKQIGLQEPFRQAGMAGQNRLMELLGLRMPAQAGVGNAPSADFGKYARDFGMSDFQADPGYAFRLSEGQKALDRTAAARGGLMSGSALKAAQRYGQEMGSQEYTNAFNRYQTNRANQLNPLQSLAGQAQTAANTIGQAGTQMASNVGEALTSGAAARASGYVGQANALSNALSGAANSYMTGQMLNRFMPAQNPSVISSPTAGRWDSASGTFIP